ncbi:MAG: antibiotic biosynthesis monooxygenase [Acidimicrobiales bacterium]
MWAQLIKTRLKEGHDDALTGLMEQFQAAEAPGSGLIRSVAMRDQNDPTAVYMLVLFESEEQARAREADPSREERLTAARATMAEVFEAPPEFVDLLVDAEYAP